MNLITPLRGQLVLIASLFFAATAAAQNQFYTVRADARQASDNIAVAETPLIEETPFWSLIEPLVESHGLCVDLQSDAEQSAYTLNYTELYAENAKTGFGDTFTWLERQGFYPFHGVSLDITDPKAPGGYPVFCAVNPKHGSESDGKLRSAFFDFQVNARAGRAFLWANSDIEWPGIEDGPDDNRAQRIQIGAALALAELWDYTRRLTLKESTPEWASIAGIDAIAIEALDAADRLDFGNYENIEQRLPFLQGDFSRRLSDFRKQAASGTESSSLEGHEEQSRGAFFRFLVKYHLNGNWGHLPAFLETLTGSDDEMQALDKYLDDYDGDPLKGLEHAFPAFVAYQASLGFTKYAGKVSPTGWLTDSFGECQTISVDEVSLTATQSIEILPFAAKCLVLRIEAKHASWNGDLQLRMQVANGQPGDDRIDDVYLSYAATGQNNLVKADQACAHNVVDEGDGMGCIIVPSAQPRDEAQVLQRYYSFPGGERRVGDKPWQLVMVSYVPSDARPGGVSGRPSVTVELTTSLDVVIGDPGDLADIGGAASGEFELLDMSTASLDHGSKVGLMPITSKLSGNDTSRRSILDGTASPIDGALLNSAMSSFDNMIQFIDEAGDGFGFIITDPSVLQPGFTGVTDAVVPFAGKDGYMSVPDPDYNGKIEIIENTKDTLHFTADEGFCMIEMSDWPKLLQQSNPNLCEFGERVTARGKGALAFPPTRRSETRPETDETDAYRALRDLRIAAIETRMSGRSNRLKPEPGQSVSGGPAHAPQTGSSAGIGQTPPEACALRDANNACDCSCEAKVCFAERQTRGASHPTDKACRLTCGKRWKSCQP